MIDLPAPRPVKNWSVSQVEKFDGGCERQWYFRSILKMPEPMREGADRGVKIHHAIDSTIIQARELGLAASEIEPQKGDWTQFVRAAQRTKHRGHSVMPWIGENCATEYRFSMMTHTGHPWIGVMDLLRDEINPMMIADWKSVNSFRYVYTPQELRSNRQLGSYAEHLFQEGVPETDTIDGGLIYMEVPKPTQAKTEAGLARAKIAAETKLPKTLPVFYEYDRATVRAIWEGTKPVLDRMLETSTKTDFNDVTPNTNICTKYGKNYPCPYLKPCGLTPNVPPGKSLFTNIGLYPLKNSENTTMGFLSSKNGAGNGAGAATGANTPPPVTTTKTPPPATRATTTTAPPATGGKPGGFLAKAKALGNVTPPAATEAERQAKLDKDFGPSKVAGVVPEDAPPRDSTAPLQAGDPGREDDEGPEEGQEAAQEGQEAVQAEAPVQEPKKRGRPKKGTESFQAPPVSEETVQEVRRAVAAGKAKRGFTLYVDVVVTKGSAGEPTDFADWWSSIEMAMNEVANAEASVPHWYLLDFGAQKALLAMKVQEWIAKGLPEAMFISSSSPMAREVLPLLLPHAVTVVKAVRG